MGKRRKIIGCAMSCLMAIMVSCSSHHVDTRADRISSDTLRISAHYMRISSMFDSSSQVYSIAHDNVEDYCTILCPNDDCVEINSYCGFISLRCKTESLGMHDFLGVDTLGRIVEYDCCPYGKPDTYVVNKYKGSLISVIKYLPDYKCKVEFDDDHKDPIVMFVESGLAEKFLRESASMDEESSEDKGAGLSEYIDTVYYADRSVKSIVQGVNGYRHGRAIEFYKSGVPKTVRTYFKNKPGPMQMHYDKDGELSQVRYNTDTVHFCVTFSNHKPQNVLYRKGNVFRRWEYDDAGKLLNDVEVEKPDAGSEKKDGCGGVDVIVF